MSDLTMLALLAICFLAAYGYAALCRRLLSSDESRVEIEQ
jgi:hypothetical protein